MQHVQEELGVEPDISIDIDDEEAITVETHPVLSNGYDHTSFLQLEICFEIL